MSEPRWAQARPDTSTPLRRGAWYRVMRLTPQQAVLDVNSRPVGISRSQLQLRPVHPGVWSVVPRPRNSGALPLSWGPRYVVCPSCRGRARLAGRTASMRCPKCGGVFEIGWGEGDLG
jgi:hypothetical protein